MLEQINSFITEVNSFNSSTLEELESFRIRFLGKKGIIPDLFNQFKDLNSDQKKILGIPLNQLKMAVSTKVEALQAKLANQIKGQNKQSFDFSIEGAPLKVGSRHPVSIVKNEIIDIFSRIGFIQSEGPEIVDDWHNFTALNFPPDHPARDMQDTFFIQKNPDYLLRTHTSPVQVQEMQANKPPIKTISIGTVYRNETISYKSHVQFHQIEGLYIDKNVSFADLKQVLYYFVEQFFGKDFKLRFRPSYFPFTETSAEMDISSTKGETKWMEILGCGMVDPNVLENCGIDSTIFSGYAFGMGITRMTMLKYGISDIRILYENDIRFLDQFVSAT